MIFDSPQKCEEMTKKYIGRTVEGLRCLGDAVFLRREYIEAAVYNRLERLGEADRDYWSRFDNIPDDFLLVRHTVVEDAFILDLDGGESISVFFPEEEKIDIQFGSFAAEKSVNFIPDKFFCRCVGKKIANVRVENGERGIGKFCIVLENGNELHFYGMLGFCAVSLIGKKGIVAPITFGELKDCLK